MRDQSRVHTVDRALQMLSAFDRDRRELGVRDFASLLDVHKSTASRLAATLAAGGFLERTPGAERFTLGPQAARIGLLAVGGRTLVEAARPAMEALAAETRETVVLSVPSGGEALDIAQTSSEHRIGVTTWIGRRAPLHASSDGKALLAFGGAELPPGPLEPLTERTITDRTVLERELARIRQTGWAPAVGDFELGLNGVAAPVFGGGRACIAAVSVSGPAYRIPPELLPALGERCAAAAKDVTARLGAEAVTA